MDQDDAEFEQLLGEIPRATSAAPLQVEELQGGGHSSGLFSSNGEEGKSVAGSRRSDGLSQVSTHLYSRESKLICPTENGFVVGGIAPLSPDEGSRPLSFIKLDGAGVLIDQQLHPEKQQQQQGAIEPGILAIDGQEQHQIMGHFSESLSQQQRQHLQDNRALNCSLEKLSLNSDRHHHHYHNRSSNEPMMHHATEGMDEQMSNNGVLNGSSFAHDYAVDSANLQLNAGPVSLGGWHGSQMPISSSSLELFSQKALLNTGVSSSEARMAFPQIFSLETAGQLIQKLPNGSSFCRSSPVPVHKQHHLDYRSTPRNVHASCLFSDGLASNINLSTNFPSSNNLCTDVPLSKQLSAQDWSPFILPQGQQHPPVLQHDGHLTQHELLGNEHMRHSQLLQEQIVLQRRLQEEHIQAHIYASIQSHASVPGLAMMPVSRMHSSMQPSLFQPCLRLGSHNQQLLCKQFQHLLPLQQLSWGSIHSQGNLGPQNSISDSLHLPQTGGLCCSIPDYCSQQKFCPSALGKSDTLRRNSDCHQLSGSYFPTISQFNPSNMLANQGTRSNGGLLSAGEELDYSNHKSQTSLPSATLLSGMYPKSPSMAQVDVEADGSMLLNPPTSHLQQQPKYSSLEEVKGRIYAIAKDQHGCRFLQRKFDEGSVEDVKTIFSEIFDNIVELMTDPFGNYLIQKFFEVCTESQRMQILSAVTETAELVSISLNMHGTRAVQKLIETLTSPEQVDMVIMSLQQGVVTLIKDLNGNHVVQRCLQRLSNKDSQFIFDAAVSHCVEIATHRHGCCVLQRCVDFASGPQRECLFSEIAANALVLSQDPYGNYVVQYILDLNILWASNEVMIRLGGNYAQLAMQKFSSNVVEKCLKLADEENRIRIVHELITSTFLGQMLQHEYANYVIQCALSVSKGALHSSLVEALRPHLATLRSSPYGKRILSRTNLKKTQFVRV
ncbi:hypothetical protein O6H91_16G049800 [Diphasiastrum complanatum]|uniref:Uncharacterized protein n=5 Tax=Diphasiastrum complanatum TaxID=34168 RepID=A0ACC2BC57_DIPCM|nr:hypothetical protein O6H91_16G049800 [Diphasiastrum complanatum]KAJ7527352.1 hypothetical protein O6H91_16G049800 [Diphasiastrum complanatum]KAJ7527353.1 hypothetical protein O6H91_16G049800 [Diphasiastrum complanatum]KAJ7527354.1 hypothetical protein O6H91_16G049800 [Diphasiastrum complanatum]KAJ7527355.1 hypothetical protein O6H91_16G049800 [Diphasiastrum complanatum]